MTGWMWDEGQGAVKNDSTPRFISEATRGWWQGHQGWKWGGAGRRAIFLFTNV